MDWIILKRDNDGVKIAILNFQPRLTLKKNSMGVSEWYKQGSEWTGNKFYGNFYLLESVNIESYKFKFSEVKSKEDKKWTENA